MGRLFEMGFEMTQSEIFEFLNKNKGKFFTAKEIAPNMEIGSVSSIRRNLEKLRRHGEIETKFTGGNNFHYAILEKKEEV